jgi:hypothetical protein
VDETQEININIYKLRQKENQKIEKLFMLWPEIRLRGYSYSINSKSTNVDNYQKVKRKCEVLIKPRWDHATVGLGLAEILEKEKKIKKKKKSSGVFSVQDQVINGHISDFTLPLLLPSPNENQKPNTQREERDMTRKAIRIHRGARFSNWCNIKEFCQGLSRHFHPLDYYDQNKNP